MTAPHFLKLCFGLGCFLILPSDIARADDIVAQARALKVISETATDICNTVEKEGSSQSAELSGNVKAKLGGVIGKIADLGVEGAGKYSSAEYRNVLQQELSKTLQSNADCKLSVFKLLQEKMVGSVAPASGSPQRN
jgi:hypothetical protein